MQVLLMCICYDGGHGVSQICYDGGHGVSQIVVITRQGGKSDGDPGVLWHPRGLHITGHTLCHHILPNLTESHQLYHIALNLTISQ